MLSQAIGAGRAKKLLLRHRITAQEAYKNSIVEDVVSLEQLEDRAMEMVRRFNDLPEQSLFGVKRLVNFHFRDIKTYLEYETGQILKIGQDKNFSNQ